MRFKFHFQVGKLQKFFLTFAYPSTVTIKTIRTKICNHRVKKKKNKNRNKNWRLKKWMTEIRKSCAIRVREKPRRNAGQVRSGLVCTLVSGYEMPKNVGQRPECYTGHAASTSSFHFWLAKSLLKPITPLCYYARQWIQSDKKLVNYYKRNFNRPSTILHHFVLLFLVFFFSFFLFLFFGWKTR